VAEGGQAKAVDTQEHTSLEFIGPLGPLPTDTVCPDSRTRARQTGRRARRVQYNQDPPPQWHSACSNPSIANTHAGLPESLSLEDKGREAGGFVPGTPLQARTGPHCGTHGAARTHLLLAPATRRQVDSATVGGPSNCVLTPCSPWSRDGYLSQVQPIISSL
jgi:hypothetical protein